MGTYRNLMIGRLESCLNGLPLPSLALVRGRVGRRRGYAAHDHGRHPVGLGVRPRAVESQRLVCGRGPAGAGAPVRVSRLWTDHVRVWSPVARTPIARVGV